MNRIGWLDSCLQPSHIHATEDNGETTICGHVLVVKPENKSLEAWWRSSHPITNVDFNGSVIPRKKHGRSNYCKECFKKTKKTIPWLKENKNGV